LATIFDKGFSVGITTGDSVVHKGMQLRVFLKSVVLLKCSSTLYIQCAVRLFCASANSALTLRSVDQHSLSQDVAALVSDHVVVAGLTQGRVVTDKGAAVRSFI
jgi:hypothetical protein